MYSKLLLTIFFYLASHQILAVEVYQIQSNQRFGHIQYSLVVDNKDMKIVKNTNYYDKKNPFLAGIAKVKNFKKVHKYVENLHEYALALKKVKTIAPSLKKEKSLTSPHATRYSLEGIEIKKGNVFYNKVKQEFQKIMKEIVPKVKEGLIFKKEKTSYISNFKEVEAIKSDLDCREERKVGFCLSDKYGFIFEVEK